MFLLLSWGQIECSVWGPTDLHYAAVTLVKTMFGVCNMEKTIATVSRELTISLPLKCCFKDGAQVWNRAVSYRLRTVFGVWRQQLARANQLSACN